MHNLIVLPTQGLKDADETPAFAKLESAEKERKKGTMFTLAQWQNTRRVDHVNIPVINLHPRFRARQQGQHPDLKMFDPLVQSYAAAATELDRIIVLGDVLDLTAAFLGSTPAPANRYLQAVQALQASALQDLTVKLHGNANAVQTDIVSAANGRALSPKHIQINVYYLAPMGANPALGPVDVDVNQQITTANNSPAFLSAGITVNRTNATATLITNTAANESILLTHPPAPANMAGKLQDSADGGTRLINVLNAGGGAGVDVVFLDEYDQNDIQGRAFRVGQTYGGASPTRPIVTLRRTPAVGGGATHATTLLHELCHAISGNGDHIQDADNLMAAGSVRNGRNQLRNGQIGWYRNNPWVS